MKMFPIKKDNAEKKQSINQNFKEYEKAIFIHGIPLGDDHDNCGADRL